MAKLTNKEKFDQRTMLYFYPNKSGGTPRVYPSDKLKMAALSSRGVKPKVRTPGVSQVTLGKDAQRSPYYTVETRYKRWPNN